MTAGEAPAAKVGAGEIEAVERATLAAVAPREQTEIDGWLLGLDPGTIRRAASAVPLTHHLDFSPAILDRIEAAYLQHGLNPAFRLADQAGLDGVREVLAARGYAAQQPTLVKFGSVAAMRDVTRAPPAEASSTPPPGWAEVFLGEGFDPLDGANRIANLTRSPDAVYARVVQGGRTVAVGVCAFAGQWASVHGMRTEKAARGQGFAGRVLAGLAAAAQARGLERVFLQVEEGNHTARALYRRAGFTPAWRYFYWTRPAPSARPG